jgi:hypothetical protein
MRRKLEVTNNVHPTESGVSALKAACDMDIGEIEGMPPIPAIPASVCYALDTVIDFVTGDQAQIICGGDHADPEVRQCYRRAYNAANIINRWMINSAAPVAD